MSCARTLAYDALLLILCLVEIGCVFWFHRKSVLGAVSNAVVFVAASVLFGCVFFFRQFNRQPCRSSPVVGSRTVNRRFVFTGLLLVSGLMLVFVPAAARIFSDMPYLKGSDIIPTIEVAVRRLLHGETVYRNLTEWGDNLPLTYLPAHWLPYTLAELLHFDYRWIAVGIFVLAAFIVLRGAARRRFHSVAILITLACFGAALLDLDPGIIGMTVELMVAGYYMLFVTQLAKDDPWLKGFVIALCMMSRYILVLWLPLWLLVELLSAKRIDTLKTIGVAALIVLAVYIIPFLSKDWGAFGRGLRYYSHAAEGEWSHINDFGVPAQLDNGLGFARVFYQKLHRYSVPDRIRSLQKIQLAVCLGAVAVMGLAYWRFRKRIDRRVFLLASFKIYVCLFLALIQVPYPYLMVTNIALSIAMLGTLPMLRTSASGTAPSGK